MTDPVYTVAFTPCFLADYPALVVRFGRIFKKGQIFFGLYHVLLGGVSFNGPCIY